MISFIFMDFKTSRITFPQFHFVPHFEKQFSLVTLFKTFHEFWSIDFTTLVTCGGRSQHFIPHSSLDSNPTVWVCVTLKMP